MTQLQIIKHELKIHGQVDNVSAFMGRYGRRSILRLGAIIHDLRKDPYNMNIETEYENKVGQRNAIYRYHKPKSQQSLI